MTAREKFSAYEDDNTLSNEPEFNQDQINKKHLRLTQADMDEMKLVEKNLFEKLSLFVTDPDLQSKIAQDIFGLHKQWLSFTLPDYSVDKHKEIVTMYVKDNRFKLYYDEKELGSAQALYDVVHYYAD